MAKFNKQQQQASCDNILTGSQRNIGRKYENNLSTTEKGEQILYGLHQSKYQGFRRTANSFTKPNLATDKFQINPMRKSSMNNSNKFSEAMKLNIKNGPIKVIRKVTSDIQRRAVKQESENIRRQFNLNKQNSKQGLVVVKSREDLKQGGAKTMIRIRPQTPKINLLQRSKRTQDLDKVDKLIKSSLLFDDFDQQIQALFDGQQQIDCDLIVINQKFLSDFLGVESEQFTVMKKIQFKINAAKHNLQAVGEILCNLEELKLSSSIIHNIRDIGTSFRQLKVLWISRCSMNDLGGLVAFQCLEQLYASFNNIQDIYDITHLLNLKIVDIQGNNVKELDQIDYLSSSSQSLIELNMQNNPVSENWVRYVKKVREVIGFMNQDSGGRGVVGLKFLDDEYIQTVRDRLKIQLIQEEEKFNNVQGCQIGGGGSCGVGDKQSDNPVERLLTHLSQVETQEALQTSILLANTSDSEDQADNKQNQQLLPEKGQIFSKTISGGFFSAQNNSNSNINNNNNSQSKQNKNTLNFYNKNRQQSSRQKQQGSGGFVSQIINNPFQQAIAGTPLQAAKLKKKVRIQTGAPSTTMDIENLLDRFKCNQEFFKWKVEEKTGINNGSPRKNLIMRNQDDFNDRDRDNTSSPKKRGDLDLNRIDITDKDLQVEYRPSQRWASRFKKSHKSQTKIF